MTRASGGWDWDWTWIWSLVFVANLPIPTLFGLGVTQNGGRIGMIAAVLGLWGLGLAGFALPRLVRRTVLIGGGVVAASQFVPILQVFAGAIAIGTWQNVDPNIDPLDSGGVSEPAGFALTLLTAQVLLVAALALGVGPAWLNRKRGVDPNAADDGPSEDVPDQLPR